MGNRLSPTGEIVFEDCEVPEENVLGQENMGLFLLLRTYKLFPSTVKVLALLKNQSYQV
jgi:alkylation response protein AidB-like acyl-CoA dehydrogenase